MPIIICLGLSTSEMRPYKCSHLDIYIPTISFVYFLVNCSLHPMAVHLMLMRRQFVFSQSLGVRRSNYI